MTGFWIYAGKAVMDIPGFRVCQVFACASVAQGSEFAWILLNNAL